MSKRKDHIPAARISRAASAAFGLGIMGVDQLCQMGIGLHKAEHLAKGHPTNIAGKKARQLISTVNGNGLIQAARPVPAIPA